MAAAASYRVRRRAASPKKKVARAPPAANANKRALSATRSMGTEPAGAPPS
jgi:hypothetical protein